MKDFVEDGIADVLRSGAFDQGQRELFAQHRQMTRPKHAQRHLVHGAHIRRNQHGIVVRAGSVRSGDQDQQGLGG